MDETLKKLIDKGTLTEEQVRDAMLTGEDTRIQAAAETFHLLMCNRPHVYEVEGISSRQPGKCYFYPEDQIDNTWELPDHQTWTKKTVEIMSMVGITLPEELNPFLKAITHMVGEATILLAKYPSAEPLLIELIKND